MTVTSNRILSACFINREDYADINGTKYIQILLYRYHVQDFISVRCEKWTDDE
jgi:short subunit dehydrogenase-like uncharacterized protein